ncbi:MAG: tRNA 2-thiouridine(34) synthase MnmA [Candidatus Paceibacterota bacterium]
MAKKTVFVGLSGGVDSAVSAALLKKNGYKVVGVFIQTWHPDFIVCNEEDERRDAMRVAAHLDIPFLTLDLSLEYKRDVANYMIDEYRHGRTPNPDVLCNSHIKFGGFLHYALSKGADFVATGHYAQQTKHSLIKAKDESKDQVYFLWQLKQKQLEKIIFPIGYLNKTQVRTLAKKFKLPVSEKKDSQGICFLGDIDLKDFLKHYIQIKKGDVLNEKGEVIGEHDGALFFTLGERHGFTITKKTPNDTRYYVVNKDIKKNTITVSQNISNNIFSAASNTIHITKTNWIKEKPVINQAYTAQIRYHGDFLPCRVICSSNDSADVVFDAPVLAASGQSIVVYDAQTMVGGGVVA